MNAASMPGQDVVDGAHVDVAGDRAALGALEVDLGDLVVLEHGDALLADVDRDEQLALRGGQRRAPRRRATPRGALLARGAVAGRRRRSASRPRRVWVFGLASVSALAAACVELVPAGRLRPRPPRLPRRRLLGRCARFAPASRGGLGVTVSAGAGAAALSSAARSSWLSSAGTIEAKNLLVGARAAVARVKAGGARAALDGWKARRHSRHHRVAARPADTVFATRCCRAELRALRRDGAQSLTQTGPRPGLDLAGSGARSDPASPRGTRTRRRPPRSAAAPRLLV